MIDAARQVPFYSKNSIFAAIKQKIFHSKPKKHTQHLSLKINWSKLSCYLFSIFHGRCVTTTCRGRKYCRETFTSTPRRSSLWNFNENTLTVYIELPSVLHLGIRDIRHAAVAGEELASVLNSRYERENAGGDVGVGAHLWDGFHEFKTVYRTGLPDRWAISTLEKTNAGRQADLEKLKLTAAGSRTPRERKCKKEWERESVCVCEKENKHTHTHVYIYISISIYLERERERELLEHESMFFS